MMYSQPSPMLHRRESGMSTANIQKILDENVQLIHNIIIHQKSGNAGREIHDLQQLLHQNLIYLATIADEATSSGGSGSQRPPQSSGGPPPGYPHMGPPDHQQGLPHYPPQSRQMPPMQGHQSHRGPPMQMAPGQPPMPPNYMPPGPQQQPQMSGPPMIPPQGMLQQGGPPAPPGHDERGGSAFVPCRPGMPMTQPPHQQIPGGGGGSSGHYASYPPQQPPQFHQAPYQSADYGMQQQRFDGMSPPAMYTTNSSPKVPLSLASAADTSMMPPPSQQQDSPAMTPVQPTPPPATSG